MLTEWRCAIALTSALAVIVIGIGFHAQAQTSLRSEPSQLKLSLNGRAEEVFSQKDACAQEDMPDLPARAFRAADGTISLFALHYQARALRGPSLDKLKIDCKSALGSSQDPDPSHYDDRRFLAATWTNDGQNIAALVHSEYHADQHKNQCVFATDLACWWNAVTQFHSTDAGISFQPTRSLVVAAPPFRQEFDQGRHRGFFSPSNIFAKGPFFYVFIATTGWSGQSYGACLLRNPTPLNVAAWRGFDGFGFDARWSDPYGGAGATGAHICKPVGPSDYSVGAVVRHRPTGVYIAVWEQPRVKSDMPGLYYATSRNLVDWSEKTLLSPGASIHDACDGGANRDGFIRAYPSVLDPSAEGRNFDDVGDQPFLYFTYIKMMGCNTGARILTRVQLNIAPPPR